MRTHKEAGDIIKSLFSAPLGSFPRGGIQSALNVRISSTPNSTTLTSEHGLSVTLKRSEDWVVIFLGEESHYPSLDKALFAMIEPILHDEISHRL